MDKVKILVVDDEPRMRKLVNDFLSRKGYAVTEASNGREACDIFEKERDTALVILDVMMPVMDGWAACREIREISDVPIIMLTAKAEEHDELLGFDLGVDEYITKPFSPRILTARVEAVLRRSIKDGPAEVLEFEDIVVDQGAHRVLVNGNEIELSIKEFELLSFFIINKGMALSRDKILESVWNYDYFGDARTIDTHVKKLRAKLGDAGDHIKTVWGMGYKFE